MKKEPKMEDMQEGLKLATQAKASFEAGLGNKQKALESFQKSLEIQPEDNKIATEMIPLCEEVIIDLKQRIMKCDDLMLSFKAKIIELNSVETNIFH